MYYGLPARKHHARDEEKGQQQKQKTERTSRDMNHHNNTTREPDDTSSRYEFGARECVCVRLFFALSQNVVVVDVAAIPAAASQRVSAATALNRDGDGRLFNHFVVPRMPSSGFGSVRRASVGECNSYLERSGSLCDTHDGDTITGIMCAPSSPRMAMDQALNGPHQKVFTRGHAALSLHPTTDTCFD